MKIELRKIAFTTFGTGILAGALSTAAYADQQILDDLIVDGSICVGQDCVNGESFGFDTLRLKENNLRIKAQDTSNSASFPSRDWQITFNDSSNGGANKFSIDDIDGGRTPFTIEAGAPSNSLYVDDGGRIGLGTSTPVADIHSKSGNTPTLRLEQDGTSGFGAQTWDMAGNEANFFIRDASNGSTLPFRIFPGAPSNAIAIEGSTGDVGLGTTSPTAPLHVSGTDGNTKVLVEEANSTSAVRGLLELKNNGLVFLSLTNSEATGFTWNMQNRFAAENNDFRITNSVGAGEELVLTQNGDLTVSGDINSVGTTVVPDYVFGADYELMPLSEVEKFIAENRHLPKIPSAANVAANGLNMTQMQMALLEKVEELTLYTLEQQKTINTMREQLDDMAN